MIAAYASGHGFGHAVRLGQVLRAVRERRPGLPLALATSADEHVCRKAAGEPLIFRSARVDVGVVQADALTIDEVGTLSAWRAFHEGHAARVDREVLWLREIGAKAVIADVPPLAFEAAAAAGIPALGLANFSWDWIWRHLARRVPELEEAAADAARAYAGAACLLELPFAGDLSAFPRRERIPLVARRPRHARHDVRPRLGLRDEDTAVLLSFGGIGLPGFELAVLGRLTSYVFLTTEGAGAPPSNVRHVDLGALAVHDIDYIDVVAAADVVVTKPGYGIVTDAIAARTRLVYTERGDFPEYPVLVREMGQWLACAHVSNADLFAGRMERALRDVLASPIPPPPRLDGAEVAADRILEALG